MTKKKTIEEFLKEATEIHGDKYEYSLVEYVNSKTKIKIICKIHGIFEQQPWSHLTGQRCYKCYGNRKKTTKEFINEAIEIHGYKYDYSQVEYKGNNKKVKIICKIHGIFEQVPISHLKNHGCFECFGKRKKKTEEFIKEASEIHKYKYDYSQVEYINIDTKVKIICKTHGLFKQIPYDHLQNHGCSKCGNIKIGNKLRKTAEEFIEQAIQVHKDKYEYSQVEYVDIDTKVKLICKIHGVFEQTPWCHLQGYNCSKCGHIVGGNKKRKTNEEFIQKAVILHNDKYNYSQVEYVNDKIKVKIICKIHGLFEQIPNKHLQGQGCNKCNNYINENETIGIIERITSKSFVKTRLRILQKLELDGYNKELKLAIEYNGEQHYQCIPFFHRKGIVDLIKQKERDSLKERLCEENGIYLITLPYWVKDKESFIKGEYETFLFIKNIFN